MHAKPHFKRRFPSVWLIGSASLLAQGILVHSAVAQGFVEDSSATLSTSNIYFNRDFREGSGQSKREEWAQGFILNVKSGYTPGLVGFGLDAQAMLGLKLDSSPDRTGTGLLPTHDDGRAPSEYSKLNLTAKARVSESELLVGSLLPKLPTLSPNTSRILPQTFEGGMATINEIDKLTISLGRLTKVKDRNSTNAEDITSNNKNRRFGGSFTADHFDWVGVDYKFMPSLAGSYHLAQLDDIYRQHFIGLTHQQALGDGTLKSELRVSISDEQGAAQAGNIDNQAWQGLFSYGIKGHRFGFNLQKMRGDNAFPYIDGSNPYLANFVQINDFAEAGQRSAQVRYDYSFAAQGLPGLSFMTRYTKGDQAELVAGGRGTDWERNSELQYVIQSGPLENVGLRWRNATYRSSYARDVDENRLIVSYSLPIW
ncbi:MAG: OprD family porin [Pseudomonas sp.]